MTADRQIGALPGRWRERGGLSGLVRLDAPAVTPGMVVVAKIGDPWRTRPELRWQTWPDLLEEDNGAGGNQTAETQRIMRALTAFTDLAQSDGMTAHDVRKRMKGEGFTHDEIRVAALVYGEMHADKMGRDQ